MNRIDRLLEVLTVLQTQKVVTVDHLKQKFHISTRMVYRDIQLLNELRIAVQYEGDKGCFILKGYCHPSPEIPLPKPDGTQVSQSIIIIPPAIKNDLINWLSANQSGKNKLK
ncbi:MAG: hypothetical protein JWR38_1949 [Mucilaginibacter sp.]|nr:hypothetical protein [Mucilaginibacter sp.]